MVIPFESPTQAPTDTLVPTPSTDPVEQWLDRVTRRLGVDRELQIEVRQELRSHLDESVAELRDAGRTAQDARDEALKLLGDEAELADALWRANRRRVRVRTIGAWAARLLAPAAAAGLVAFLAYGALVAAALVRPAVFAFNVGSYGGGDNAGERYRAATLADAPEDVRLLFEMGRTTWQQDIANAKRLAERRPDDPALYANYAARLERAVEADTEWTEEPGPENNEAATLRPKRVRYDAAKLAEALAVFAEGERREPGNGLYPGLAASLLFRASSSATYEDPALTVQRPGRPEPESWSREVVYDERLHADALAAAGRAAAAPYFRAYAAELAARKAAALPAGRVADVWLRGMAERSGLSPSHAGLDFAWRLATHATTRAESANGAGGREEARRLLRDLRLLAGKVAESASTTMDVHLAGWMARAADEADARVLHAAAGDAAAAEQAWAKLDEARHRFDGVRLDERRAERRYEQWGLLYGGVLRDAIRYGGADPAPMRRAEYAAADQFGVAAVSAALLAAGGVYALVVGVQWLRTSRTSGGGMVPPPRLFVGWRRVAWVAGMGAVAPVVLYVLYAGVEPLSGRGDGLNVTLGRVLVEYGLLALTVLLLVIGLSRRAVLQRMAELGVASRGRAGALPRWRRGVAVGGLAAGAACMTAVLVFAAGMFRDVPNAVEQRAVPPLLIAAWASLGCAAAAAGLWRRGTGSVDAAQPVIAGTLARSAFPVVMVAALVVALAGLPLRRVETENVAAVVAGSGPLVSEKAVGESGYDAVREELVREYDVMLGREGK